MKQIAFSTDPMSNFGRISSPIEIKNEESVDQIPFLTEPPEEIQPNILRSRNNSMKPLYPQSNFSLHSKSALH